MNVADFVNKYPFSNPLQRLILLKVLMSGSLNGQGERVLDHEVLANFCCCSRDIVLEEVMNLARANFLKVRKFGNEVLSEKEQKLLEAPGTLLLLDKQRDGEGWMGKIPLVFNPLSNQFLSDSKSIPFNYARGQSQSAVISEMRRVAV